MVQRIMREAEASITNMFRRTDILTSYPPEARKLLGIKRKRPS